MSGREVQGGVFDWRWRSREWTRRLSFDMTEDRRRGIPGKQLVCEEN